MTVTREFLERRTSRAEKSGYGKARWIEFCERMLAAGFEVSLYEARFTVSKYVTVSRDGRTFKVRFSNHKPIRSRELKRDCDFFVGITHTGVRTTDMAVEAVLRFFAESATVAGRSS